MRRPVHQRRLPASLAALALVVPLLLVGLAPPSEVGAVRALGVAPAAAPASDRIESDRIDLAAGSPVASTATMSISSGLTVFGLAVSAQVTVSAPGATPTGQVQVLVDGTAVATGWAAADGTARVRLPATVAAGRHAVTAVYSGTADTDPPVLPSSTTARDLTVTRTLPLVRTDGTDWSVGRSDTKAVHVQVTGFAGVDPTGTVVVWVNGVRTGTARLDASGGVVVPLATSTKTAAVVVTYGGDGTFLPWAAPPRLLVVR